MGPGSPVPHWRPAFPRRINLLVVRGITQQPCPLHCLPFCSSWSLSPSAASWGHLSGKPLILESLSQGLLLGEPKLRQSPQLCRWFSYSWLGCVCVCVAGKQKSQSSPPVQRLPSRLLSPVPSHSSSSSAFTEPGGTRGEGLMTGEQRCFCPLPAPPSWLCHSSP